MNFDLITGSESILVSDNSEKKEEYDSQTDQNSDAEDHGIINKRINMSFQEPGTFAMTADFKNEVIDDQDFQRKQTFDGQRRQFTKELRQTLGAQSDDDAAIQRLTTDQQGKVEQNRATFFQKNYKRQIEIKNGVMQMFNSSVLEYSNRLEINRYRRFKGKLLFMADTFLTLDQIAIALFFLVYSFADTVNYSWIPHAIVGVISIIIQGIVNIVVDLRQQKAQEQVNDTLIEVAQVSGRKKKFKLQTWGELRVGNIVKLYSNQLFPADVLILDIQGSKNDQQTCNMWGGLWQESGTCVLKRSLHGTANKTGFYISDDRFISSISGTLKWDYNHHGLFSGSFKQESSATGCELTIDNVVKRGCYISQARQIIGIVLNVGNHTIDGGQQLKTQKDHQLINIVKESLGTISSSVNGQHSAMLLIWILVAIFSLIPCSIFILHHVWRGNRVQKFLVHIFDGEKYELNARNLASSAICMSICLPYLLKLSLDIIDIFQSFFAAWDINLAPANLTFNNPCALSPLSNLDSLILNKQAIINGKKQVHSFRVDDMYYFSEQSTFAQKNQKMDQTQFQEELQSDSSDSDQFEINYLPTDSHLNFQFESEQVKQILGGHGALQMKLEEFILAVCICHHGQRVLRFSTKEQEQHHFKSVYPEDEAQLDFAYQLGYAFKSRQKNIINIKKNCQNKGYNLRFEVQVTIRLKFKEEWITATIIKGSYSEGSCIYFKGPHKVIFEMLRNQQQDPKLHSETLLQERDGTHCISFAKRPIDDLTSEALSIILNKSKAGNKESETTLHDFILQQTSQLDYLGSLGLSPVYKLRDALMLEELEKNGVKLWIVSGDNQSKDKVDYLAIDLYDNYHKPFTIEGSNERKIKESLKYALKDLNDRLIGIIKIQTAGEQSNRKSTSRLTNALYTKRQKTGENATDTVTLKNCMQIGGKQLGFILQDESLLVLFLTLASFCSLITLSEVDPLQRAALAKHLREYNKKGGKGTVMGVISTSNDRYLIKEVDVSLALQKRHVNSDLQAASDLVISELYCLTYLLFKHGTQLYRRKILLQENFLYKSILLSVIFLLNFILCGFSSNDPFNTTFLGLHVGLITPFGIICQAIFHKNYGYEVFHRILGEYKMNQLFSFWSLEIAYQVILKGVVDALQIIGILMFKSYFFPNDSFFLLSNSDGQIADTPSIDFYFQFTVTMAFCSRLSDVNFIQIERNISMMGCFLFSLLLMFIDENLEGINQTQSCPLIIMQIIFVFVAQQLRNFFFLSIRTLWPITKCVKQKNFYTQIEDRLFLEQYDEPHLSFEQKKESKDYAEIVDKIHRMNLHSINLNMMRTQRSDSSEQILETINKYSSEIRDKDGAIKAYKSTDGIINKFSLKLNDPNKERMYNQQSGQIAYVMQKLKILRLSIISFMIMLADYIHKLILNTNSDQVTNEKAQVAIGAFLIFQGLIVYYIIYKFKWTHSETLLKLHTLIAVVLISVQKILDKNDQKVDDCDDCFVLFYFCVVLLIAFRFSHVFLVTLIITGLYAFYVDRVAKSNQDRYSIMQQNVNLIVTLLTILLWISLIYLEEFKKKLSFVKQYHAVKEYQKLKSLSQILVHKNVKDLTINKASEIHHDVTILHCKIDDFDGLVNLYDGGEGMLGILQQLQGILDVLCEQFGLARIEQVGKSFTICGGLKKHDAKIDQRILNEHHSVRVAEFALALQSFAKTKVLKNNKRLVLNFGINQGPIVSGLIGEFNPQYSLFGQTLILAKEASLKSKNGKILVTESAQQTLIEFSNNIAMIKTSIKIAEPKQQVFIMRRKKNDGKNDPKKPLKQSPDQQKKSDNSLLKVRQQTIDLLQSSSNDSVGYKFDNSSFMITEEMDGQRLDDSLASQAQMNISSEEAIKVEEKNAVFDHCNFKPDQEIVRNPIENERYRLVERPRMLLEFNNSEIERVYSVKNINDHNGTDIFALCLYTTVGDTIIYYIADMKGLNAWQQTVWLILSVIATLGIEWMRYKFRQISIKLAQALDICLQFCTAIVITSAGPLQHKFLNEFSQEPLYNLCIMLAYFAMSIEFRSFMGKTIVVTVCQLIAKFVTIKQQNGSIISIILHQMLISCVYWLIGLMSYDRAMRFRTQYNEERILIVETEKIEEAIVKLVPLHIFEGIKSEKQIIDQLDQVTILFARLRCIDNNNNSMSFWQEYASLLQTMFRNFDSLCEMRQLYKVYSVGDVYVVMSYNGKVSKDERRSHDLVEEAHDTIQMAFSMLQVVADIREKGSTTLKNIDLQIGIHTGKILGGLIGQTHVRYDIFGEDVFKTFRVMEETPNGTIRMSEKTHKLIQLNKTICENFEFQPHTDVMIQNQAIPTYTCEQVFVQASVQDDTSEEEEEASEEEIQEEGSQSDQDSDEDSDEELSQRRLRRPWEN